MFKIARRGILGLALVTSLGGGIVATAGSAAAIPSSCNVTKTTTQVSVRCTGGTGQARAWVQCYDPFHGSYSTVTTGPWVGLGSTSTIKCPKVGLFQWTVQAGHYGFDVRN